MSPLAPLCSVIVPLYKHEAWLAPCLESVLEQTHLELELIVIDDQSPDGSFALAEAMTSSAEFRLRFRRIVCSRNESNLGAHESLNRGIAQARGEYLFLLNSDDCYHPHRVERMLSAMRAANSRFAFSAVSLDVAPGARVPENVRQITAALDHEATLLPSLSFLFLRFNATITTGNFAMHRDLVEAVGPFIDLKLAHDWDYVLRTILFEEPLYVPERLYRYRVHLANTFTAVAARSQIETEICLSRYLSIIAAGRTRNPNAPSPLNWPGIFEDHLLRGGLDDLWNRTAHGHVRDSRTSTIGKCPSTLHAGPALKCR